MSGYYVYGFNPYYANAMVGQAADQPSQWEQSLNEETNATFQQETGRPYPENFEMRIVWLTFKYATVTRHLERLRLFPEAGSIKWGPKGPYQAAPLVRWLAEYQTRLNRLFAENPTWDRRAQEAMQRIKSQRSARSGAWYY